MSNVISIAEVRAENFRQALEFHARKGETVTIETDNGAVTAERISCRSGLAEILDTAGDYFVVNYRDIRSLKPAAVAQTSVVNARGHFSPVHHPAALRQPVAILPFARRQRRT